MLDDLLTQALGKARQLAERGSAELHYLQKMIQSGAFGLEPPQNIAGMLTDIRRWGEVGMIPALNARRTPHRTAIIDDEGTMTFAELNDASNAVANGLLAMGVRGGDGVAILARNHRWFLGSSQPPPCPAGPPCPKPSYRPGPWGASADRARARGLTKRAWLGNNGLKP
jgi:fatty-acyl-CoA synthase